MSDTPDTKDRRTYNGIDIVKFFMALCVVMIHVKAFFPDFSPGLFVDFIISLAVPFFFIASGFLLANKTATDPSPDKTLKYSKRIWRMYVVWILIYIPLSTFGEIMQPREPSLTRFFIVQLRSALLLGDIRYSYPTWYLYSLGFASSMIYFFQKKKLSMTPLLILGIIGILLQYAEPMIDVSKTAKTAIHSLSRMTIGVGYVIFGMLLFRHHRFVTHLASAALTLGAIVLFIFRMPFSETVGSISLFIFALLLRFPKSHGLSLWFRKQSLWIFLIHMYALTPLCLFALLPGGWTLFFAAATISIAVSQFLIAISRTPRGHFLNRLT